MTTQLAIIFFALNITSVVAFQRIFDCRECGGYENTLTECEQNGRKGFLYERSLAPRAGCDVTNCDTQLCAQPDYMDKCEGMMLEGVCDEYCEQKKRILHFDSRDRRCDDVLSFESCLGGECNTFPSLSEMPEEELDCSGCGDWRNVGKCREAAGGQYKWRRITYPTCDRERCGDFACDLSNACTGEFVDGPCTEDCMRQHRVWEKNGELCQDTIKFKPCFVHDHCIQVELYKRREDNFTDGDLADE